MDHGKLKWYILCPRRLQATQDDCAVRVQRLCSVLECAGKKRLDKWLCRSPFISQSKDISIPFFQ